MSVRVVRMLDGLPEWLEGRYIRSDLLCYGADDVLLGVELGGLPQDVVVGAERFAVVWEEGGDVPVFSYWLEGPVIGAVFYGAVSLRPGLWVRRERVEVSGEMRMLVLCEVMDEFKSLFGGG